TDGRGRRADTDGRGRPAGPRVRPPGPRPPRPGTRSQTQELARLRRRRHRMTGVLAAGLILVLLVGLAWVVRGWLHADPGSASLATGLAAGLGSAAPTGSVDPAGSPQPGGSGQPSGSAGTGIDVAAANANVPDKGAGTFAFAAGTGTKLGSAGTLRHYRVAVENGAQLDPNAFAAQVDSILGDPKGWTAGGKVTFQRVPQGSSYDVTIYLATPATTDQMCATGGLHVQKYLSCRLPGQIVINLGRWQNAVPDYGAPIDTYRQFALNHEVGRDLGYANEACPGQGQLAPVMQQQSLSLDGCVPNAWPYPQGSLYQGRPVP
ncbi:MAG TPA: DUF3152 domain-containing protein, partial [Rugosimonospora sp.]|nr:DUF3152 domain-containing protein [Rugosimonospora sp.]